jgi:hypothetical protein
LKIEREDDGVRPVDLFRYSTNQLLSFILENWKNSNLKLKTPLRDRTDRETADLSDITLKVEIYRRVKRSLNCDETGRHCEITAQAIDQPIILFK